MSEDGSRRGPWIIRASKLIYENPWIGITEHAVTDPRGHPGLYGVVHLQNLAVGCVPVFPDGTTLLVGQHRFPHDVYSWELPEGGGSFENPQDSAERELREETGFTAASWAPLMKGDLSNAVTDESAVGFIAWDLTPGEADPQDGEVLEVRRLPFKDLLDQVLDDQIRDVFTQVMVLRVDALGHRGLLPEQVASALGYA